MLFYQMHFLSPFTTDFYFISQLLLFYICFTTVKAAWIKEQNFQKDIKCITYRWVPILLRL